MAKTLIGPDPVLINDTTQNGNTLVLKKNVAIVVGSGNAINLGSAVENVTLKISGRAQAPVAIESAAEQSKIVVEKSGTVLGNPDYGSGIYVTAAVVTEVVNKGYVTGAAGINVLFAAADVVNSGVTAGTGPSGAAIALSSDSGSVLNTGILQSTHIGIQDIGHNNTLVNEGSIWASIGVYSSEVSSDFQNLGEVHATYVGHFLATPVAVSAENAGLIDAGSWAVYSNEALSYLNTGTLKGDNGVFYVNNGALNLTNQGKIVGDVHMTENDDTYFAVNKGVVKGRVEGGDGADTMTGAKKKDLLYGQEGIDVLSGGGGKDRLVGGDGADILNGGSGNDVLKGGAQDDTIDGGSGNDFLSGGSDDDIFKFTGNRPGKDVIRDFAVSDDNIDLSAYGLDAGGITALLQAINYGATRTVIDLGVIDGVKGSITLEGWYDQLVEDNFIFS